MRSFFVLTLVLAGAGCQKDAVEDSVVAVDCSGRDTIVPSPRGEVRGVWDADRGRLVLFGGNQAAPENCNPKTEFVGDVWALSTDCDTFEELSPADGPGPRGRYSVALDAARGRALLHGGRYRDGNSGDYEIYDELWALDLATDTWSLLSEGGPGARFNHTIDVAGDRLILFGGNTSASSMVYTANEDVWSFDLAGDGGWEEISVSGTPEPRLYQSAATSEDTLYVYGGTDETLFSATADFFDDVWALDLASGTWSELHGGGNSAPEGRFGAGMELDVARDRLLIWAGHDDSTLGATNELWAFDLGANEWTPLSEGDVYNNGSAGFCDFPADFVDPDLGAPERRYAGATVLAGDELMIFGGKTDCGLLNDVWGWDLANGGWNEHSAATSGEICLRAYSECESMCF